MKACLGWRGKDGVWHYADRDCPDRRRRSKAGEITFRCGGDVAGMGWGEISWPFCAQCLRLTDGHPLRRWRLR
jgi:hypothetical protein